MAVKKNMNCFLDERMITNENKGGNACNVMIANGLLLAKSTWEKCRLIPDLPLKPSRENDVKICPGFGEW